MRGQPHRRQRPIAPVVLEHLTLVRQRCCQATTLLLPCCGLVLVMVMVLVLVRLVPPSSLILNRRCHGTSHFPVNGIVVRLVG